MLGTSPTIPNLDKITTTHLVFLNRNFNLSPQNIEKVTTPSTPTRKEEENMLSLFRNPGVASARRVFSTSTINASGYNIARITLLGFLGTEPEIASLPDGREIIRYTVGVSQGRDKPISWFRVANFNPEERGGKEYIATMPKGTRVFVEGDVTLSLYQGEDGKSHKCFNIFQRSIQCLARSKLDTQKPDQVEDTEDRG